MLTNFLQSLVNVVDILMVGRLGPLAIGAVGMAGVIRMLVLVMMLSVAAGAMSLIAQAKGARDPQRMSLVTRQAISSGLLVALLLTVAGLLLARPLMMLANSGGDPEAVALGTSYLRILFLGTPFLILNIVCNRLMQGAGDTVTPLLLTSAINFLNIGLNALFIFGIGPLPAFGVDGAAMGTVISRGIGLVAVLSLFYSGRNVVKILPGTYRPQWRMFADILAIGVPSGIQGLFRNGSRLLVISIVTSTEIGTYGAAALAIGLQVESLAFMPVLGINVAATSLVGQALGAWQVQRARQSGNSAILLGILIMGLLITPIILLAPRIISLFDPSAHPTVMAAGTAYLRINTVMLPMAAIAMVANGALRGAGDTLPAMFSTLMTRGVVSVCLAWLFAFPFGLGSTGVWYALAVGMALDGIVLGSRWRSNAWVGVALHRTELYRKHLQFLDEAVQQQYLADIRTPCMAQPGVQEKVESDRVVYALSEESLCVRFINGNYQVISTAAD
jgi:putative MATE family efflux protein